MPELESLKQENQELKLSLGCTKRLCFKIKGKGYYAYNSVVEHLPSLSEALGFILSI
jgi:hypothetical protein